MNKLILINNSMTFYEFKLLTEMPHIGKMKDPYTNDIIKSEDLRLEFGDDSVYREISLALLKGKDIPVYSPHSKKVFLYNDKTKKISKVVDQSKYKKYYPQSVTKQIERDFDRK